jgi:hypothetical protein
VTRTGRLGAIAVVVGGTVLAVVSCDKNSPTNPPTPSSPIVTVRLIAPEQIAPGGSVQLTADAVKTDGTTENVNRQAVWSSTNPAILQVTPLGLASARARGESIVSAQYGGKLAEARIFVLPDGTFRLVGRVGESGFGVAGASVTVVSGTGQGLTTDSASDGSYRLYGVSGAVRIRVQKEAYEDGLHDVSVTAHGTRDFELVRRSRTDYRGTYRLTFVAASPCSTRFLALFPDAAKRREYTANVLQDGVRVTVTLSDANFIVTNGRGNSFSGLIEIDDTVTFRISDPDFYYYYSAVPEIVERFDDVTLIVSGTVSVRGTPAFLSGTFDGSLLAASRSTYPFGPFSSCVSQAHGFEMVRR